MIRVENSYLIDRSAAAVFEVFSQVGNMANAFPTVRRVEVIDADHVSVGAILKMGLLSLDSNVNLEVTERHPPLRLVAKGTATPGKGLAAAARMVDKEGLTQITMTLDLEELGPEKCRIHYQVHAEAHGNLKRVYNSIIKGQREKLEGAFVDNLSKIMGTPIVAIEGAAKHTG
ncbi:MAG: SRPBCC family protein [Rhodospirillales bacterium]|nr:SRPBCC family protein [Rhodospirillales bacterium]